MSDETTNQLSPADAPVFVRVFCAPDVKVVDVRQRMVTHLITTASIDRVGDVVEPGGANVANFLKNPVVMADHDYRIERIVGRAENIEIGPASISATTRFHDEGIGLMAFNLIKAGMARAWSIGFRPSRVESIADDEGKRRGFRFKAWELLEYSLVAVPANPDVVMNAVSKGYIDAASADVFFRSALVLPDSRPASAARPDANAGKAVQRPSSRLYDALLGANAKLRRLHAAGEMAARIRS